MSNEAENEEWPDTLYEIEAQTDVDRFAETLKVKRKWDATFEGEIDPGERVTFIVSELKVEITETDMLYLFVEDQPVWKGARKDLEHVHSYRDAKSNELMIVAVNGSFVWTRLK
jgi:hypothetical protein